MKIQEAEPGLGPSTDLLFDSDQEIDNFNSYLLLINVKSERWDSFIRARAEWGRKLRLNVAKSLGGGRKELLEAAEEFRKLAL